jgi:hypothetical protein
MTKANPWKSANICRFLLNGTNSRAHGTIFGIVEFPSILLIRVIKFIGCWRFHSDSVRRCISSVRKSPRMIALFCQAQLKAYV